MAGRGLRTPRPRRCPANGNRESPSAATATAANRGVEDRRIKLGCVMPGESPPQSSLRFQSFGETNISKLVLDPYGRHFHLSFRLKPCYRLVEVVQDYVRNIGSSRKHSCRASRLSESSADLGRR